MAAATHSEESGSAHSELHTLRAQLHRIHESIIAWGDRESLAAELPILDSSLELDPNEGAAHDTQWRQHERVLGMKNLKESVKRDLDGLDKFLAEPSSAFLPPLSTNAPYLIAVWNEIQSAPAPVLSIFRSFTIRDGMPGMNGRAARRVPAVKVDVVADGGRQWIRVNTIKNSRILSEFHEMDSYLTDSDEDGDSLPGARPSLAPTEFDNSVLRMGRLLLSAARDSPIPRTNEIPGVILHLTRLDPSPTNERGEENDIRIARTVNTLREMGIDVQLGEREIMDLPAPSPSDISLPLEPTRRVNLDLSILIALVSDLTHAPLPETEQEAKERFRPSQSYREWKKQRMQLELVGNGKTRDDDMYDERPEDMSIHSRQLTTQALQEMVKALIQEIRDRLCAIPSPSGRSPNDEPSISPRLPSDSLSEVQFWTTPEACDRCLRIVSKIGGPDEKRRVNALFPSDTIDALSTTTDVAYWLGSRFAPGYIPLLPIHIYPSSEALGHTEFVSQSAMLSASFPFFHSLTATCTHILAQDTRPNPRIIPTSLISDESRSSSTAEQEIQRASVMKANPKLTAHTVRSMLWGAELGWTTLTANKASVRAILREMRAARAAGQLPPHVQPNTQVSTNKAAIWIVDPRSLAEGMRADSSVTTPLVSDSQSRSCSSVS